MKLNYNIDFSIAAAIFLSIFILFVIFSYDMKVRKNRGFLLLMVVILVADIMDIVTAYTISSADTFPVGWNIFLNEIYYLVLGALGYIFLRYSQEAAVGFEEKREKGRLPLKQVYILLTFVYIALLIINIPTGIMMSFRDGKYIHGPLYFILFFYPYLEVAFAFTRVIMRADEYKKRGKRALIWIYFAFCVSCAAIQLFLTPDILITIFSVSIGLTFLLILMETPDYQSMMAAMEKLKDTQRQLREQAEAAQQRSMSKTEFLLHLSHELRTPLNAIVGYSEVILGDKKKRSAADDVKQIRTASRNLLSITENIKNFIEIEDEDVSIENDEYDTVNLIRDMKGKVFFYNADKKLKVNIHVDPNLPTKLFGDRIRLQQLMDTLTSNAIKYTDNGEVDIEVGWNVSGLTFSVEDTGIGMKPQDLKRIGEIFYKANPKDNASGLGLGLAFATRLLKKMDSKLEYESSYRVGSRFWFTIRQGDVSHDRIGAKVSEQLYELTENTVIKTEGSKANKFDILVVDDNKINIDITMKLLSDTGAHVESAMNGKEAIDRIRDREKPYDIIFMDHLMPVMDGVEAMDCIRRENLCPDTPVIALTANAVTDVEREYTSHGFASYILKPATKNALLEMINRYCKVTTPEKKKSEPVESKEERAEALYHVPETRPTEKSAEVQPEKPASRKKNKMERLSGFLNTSSGLTYCAGMQDFYIEIIGDYISGDKRQELDKELKEEDYENYRIGVHSLKSSSRTIGADALSERAKQLEDACKADDREYIAKHHDKVMEEYGNLLDKLKEALSDEPEETAPEEPQAPEVKEEPLAPQTPAEKEETADVNKPKMAKILLAVSFGVERDVLSYLIGRDYDVIEAPDRETAFERYREDIPDLCIFDSEMTKGHENSFLEITAPMIFLTDERDRQAKIRAMSCGAADIIERPVDERFMRKRIRSVLATKGVGV
ncbi:MAG: response regulator [Lachnospiraceae bacterium]|nr:response regulator [Lachnospiraceae bacterium]